MQEDWNEETVTPAVALAQETGSAQITIIYRGKTLANAAFAPAPVDVYAVQKGLTVLLFGIAEAKGLLRITDPVNRYLNPGWTNLPPELEASLTIKTLLNMTSGMDDMLNPLGQIGQTWRYNNTSYNYLKKVLCLCSGMDLQATTRNWLTGPLGMTQTSWVDREQRLPDNTPLTGLLATANDLAMLGTLVGQQGRHDGGQLVPAEFISMLGKPGSAENPAWGLCWWNNNQAHYKNPMQENVTHEGPIIPAAPAELIAARGAMQNALYVVPALELVVARTASPPLPGQRPKPFEQVFWSLLMKQV